MESLFENTIKNYPNRDLEQLLLIKKATFKNNFVFWKTFANNILLFSKLWCNLEYNCLFWPENFYELFFSFMYLSHLLAISDSQTHNKERH